MRRAGVRGLRLALGLAVILVSLVGLNVQPAWAADSYDRFDVDYVVAADGSTRVTETIVLRFGPDSGRHGLERYLVVREPWDEDSDVTYDITDVNVTSPTPGVSTQTQVTTSSSGRERSMRIRVGDPNRTVRAASATYVVSYTVRGALRSSPGYAEFYWDALGPGLDRIASAAVSVEVPGGAQEVTCYAGRPQSQNACTSATISGGVARFTQRPLAAGNIMTVGVKIDAAAVANAEPVLVEREGAAAARMVPFLLGAGGVGAVIVPILGWLYYRRRGRDERFAGMPPGTFPPSGRAASVVAHDADTEIPVSFAPPKLPLMYAGLLLEGRSQVRHLTATLVGLATHGALRLEGAQHPLAVALDPGRTPDRPSRMLFEALFAGTRGVVDFTQPGDMDDARRILYADAQRESRAQRWFRSLPIGRKTGLSLSLVWVIWIVAMGGGSWLTALGPLLWVLGPITLSAVITIALVRSRMARGQRTAVGRAWTDQIEGFRTYIATAEAEQLRFEEGEDIFSRYLPWAILFGLADRWVRVCERAVALGLLDEPDASWYGQHAWNTHVLLWNLNAWDTGLSAAATPPTPSFSSGTGFGGGSSFGGGGGFSGGGGGGGGGGSW